MMMEWVKLPTAWIQEQGLRNLRWAAGKGSDNIAALMSLIAFAHHADQQTGEGRMTYDRLCLATGLSRPKQAAGLSTLEGMTVIRRGHAGRSSFKLINFDPSREWGKLPARRLYHKNGSIPFLHELKLRQYAELDALKLFLLIVARRDEGTNMARMSYDKIEEYSGIDRNRIRSAIALLASHGLIFIDPLASMTSDMGVSNAYRLAHIDPRRHQGTTGRRELAMIED